MSKLITRHKHFISLLMKTSKEQSRALLYTITIEQVTVLSEIIFNLLTLPLKKKQKDFITRRNTLFNKLGNKKTSNRVKIKLIRKNLKIILELIQINKLLLKDIIT